MAYGKWGSRELTIGSDLDLVTVYDAPENAQSDGPRKLAAPGYYMRLTQRLVTALNTMTGEGRLFDVDLRLRPHGEDGPVAAHIRSIEEYLGDNAWTWELMALTRARAAVGDEPLIERIEDVRRRAIAAAQGRDGLLADVASMRRRIAAAKPARGDWDVRGRRGGMVDADFVAQGLTLALGGAGGLAAARGPAAQLAALAEVPDAPDLPFAELAEAARFWLEAQWLLRLVGFDPAEAADIPHPAIQATVAAALGAPDYPAVCRRRDEIAANVAAAFDIAIGTATSDAEPTNEARSMPP